MTEDASDNRSAAKHAGPVAPGDHGGRLRTLVVDDEPLARRGLRRLLAEHPRVDLVGECGNGQEAVRALEAGGVDLVLLDIEMPGMNGFDVVHAVGPGSMPPVVFVTAFDQYAVRAFEAHAIDYVQKPVDPERLGEALRRACEVVDRARELRGASAGSGGAPDGAAGRRADPEPMADLKVRLEALLERIEARERYPQRLVVRGSGRVHFVPVGEVDWIESAGNYVRLHCDGRVHLQRETLAGLEGRLDPKEFVRIHRSAMVRVDRVRSVSPLAHGDCSIELACGTGLTVSRRYRGALDALLRGLA